MKMNRAIMAACLLGTMGGARAVVAALDDDSAARRIAIDPPEPRYGRGTGKVPEGFESTERDKVRMAAAEEKRARRNARNLRNLKS